MCVVIEALFSRAIDLLMLISRWFFLLLFHSFGLTLHVLLPSLRLLSFIWQFYFSVSLVYFSIEFSLTQHQPNWISEQKTHARRHIVHMTVVGQKPIDCLLIRNGVSAYAFVSYMIERWLWLVITRIFVIATDGN